jgi:hypothetical protein
VVYHNPQHEEVLRRFPGLHPVTRVNSRLRGCDTAIYCTMFAP